MARQAARSVLPNATETKIFVTANARAIRHFLEQRGSRHAETEIRQLANRVLRIMKAESPNLFGDYREIPLPDGTFEIDTDFRKV
jgi:thymidylate synthase (FAD)